MLTNRFPTFYRHSLLWLTFLAVAIAWLIAGIRDAKLTEQQATYQAQEERALLVERQNARLEVDRLAVEAAAKAKAEEEVRLAAEEQAKQEAARLEAERIAAEQAAAAERARLAALATPKPKSSPSPKASPSPAPASTPEQSQNLAAVDGDSSFIRQTVGSSRGSYSTTIMSFNLGSGRIKVVTDTAADGDCRDDCPTLPVMEYVKRNGGFAGINGTYFCPIDYSWCANESGSFFWKIFNTRLNTMINKDNKLGENDPFLTFDSAGRPKYYSRWIDYMSSGASIIAGINSKPALIYEGRNVLDEGSLDTKQRTAKISRAALGLKGTTLSAVVVSEATISDLAAVVEALGMEYAVNIDAGGSSAVVYNSQYMIGPGRSVPNAVVFVKQ